MEAVRRGVNRRFCVENAYFAAVARLAAEGEAGFLKGFH